MKEKAESEKTLLSEVQTAKFCGVTVNTLRKHREKGGIAPVESIAGVVSWYDPEAVKRYFDTDPAFQAAKARRAGHKIVSDCKTDFMAL